MTCPHRPMMPHSQRYIALCRHFLTCIQMTLWSTIVTFADIFQIGWYEQNQPNGWGIISWLLWTSEFDISVKSNTTNRGYICLTDWYICQWANTKAFYVSNKITKWPWLSCCRLETRSWKLSVTPDFGNNDWVTIEQQLTNDWITTG
jgi:hypothetical protein